MAIPSQPTTAISLGPANSPTQRSLSVEFSDTQPYQLDQYRRSPSPLPGNLVPSNPANASIPTSPGQSLSFSQFNGATSAAGVTVVNYQVTASNTDVDLLRFATSPNRPVPTRYTAGQPNWQVTFTIANNVIISSSSYLRSLKIGALTTNTASPTTWFPDTTITIVNQGAIVGAGGTGGTGGNAPASAPASTAGIPGKVGGIAVNAQRAVTIQNNPGPWARISGGGGGGAGGGGKGSGVPTPAPNARGGGGGGGGAGRTVGFGGGGGPSVGAPGTGGQSASSLTTPQGVSANGAAGAAAQPTRTAGPGGAFGASGGASGPSLPALGGNTGHYAIGSAQITWQQTGTRQGLRAPGSQTQKTLHQYPFTANTSGIDVYLYATAQAPVPTRYTAGQPGHRLEFNINPGVLITSPTGGQGAIFSTDSASVVPQGFHPDCEIYILNQGTIISYPGTGGSGVALGAGGAGQPGGIAIIATNNGKFVVQNQGVVSSGGGGGGASGGYPPAAGPTFRAGAGGGRGSGRDKFAPVPTGQPGAPGSVGQQSTNSNTPPYSTAGNGGTTQAPIGPVPVVGPTLTGGNGGGVGQAGQAGQPNPVAAPLSGGAGGAAGAYGSGAIIWQELGTVNGTAPPTSW